VISLLLQGFVRLSVQLLKVKQPEDLVPEYFLNMSKLFDPTSSLHSFNFQIPAEELKVRHLFTVLGAAHRPC
jgi:hypothetical protein